MPRGHPEAGRQLSRRMPTRHLKLKPAPWRKMLGGSCDESRADVCRIQTNAWCAKSLRLQSRLLCSHGVGFYVGATDWANGKRAFSRALLRRGLDSAGLARARRRAESKPDRTASALRSSAATCKEWTCLLGSTWEPRKDEHGKHRLAIQYKA